MDFDSIDAADQPMYSVSFVKSLKYMYLMSLGEFGADSYDYTKGKNPSETFFLYVLFCIVSFMMIILLLNLLVALMGEPFEAAGGAEEANKAQAHLKFILSHWSIDEEKAKSIKYLVTAYLNEEL